MNKISNIKILALFLACGSFASADLDASPEGVSKIKYIGYSQLGNPADVLKVKTEAARALSDGIEHQYYLEDILGNMRFLPAGRVQNAMGIRLVVITALILTCLPDQAAKVWGELPKYLRG